MIYDDGEQCPSWGQKQKVVNVIPNRCWLWDLQRQVNTYVKRQYRNLHRYICHILTHKQKTAYTSSVQQQRR